MGRMKLLIFLAVVALVHADAKADADATPVAEAAPDADALLYYRTYGHFPAYYYGHYPYIIGRKRRDAEAEAAPDADADAGAAPDADADALLYYRTYGYYPSYYYGHYP